VKGETHLGLTEIYSQGSQILEGKKYGIFLRGVETEFGIRHNEEIFKKYKFLQRTIGAVEANTKVRLLNVDLEVPIVMSSISAPIPQIQANGLLKVASALKGTGSMMWLGTPIPANLKEIAQIGVPVVQTVKPYRDRKKVVKWLSDAEEAGVTWVGIEIDAGQGTKILDQQIAKDCSPISLDELRDIRQRVSRPFVLKGVLSPWDAEKALEVGADAIVVSNHGVHTVDYLPHPLEVMGDIVRVIAGKIPIIVDGGFRRGTDVLKGLAFGAQAVGIGRPILYGLAAGGENGVRAVITEMGDELRRAMTVIGVKDPCSAHKGFILHD
jgi:isopentenyl diphosphate isomerase/L-lactate dehydrogenase-like FMN-dependent dehydrogenase